MFSSWPKEKPLTVLPGMEVSSREEVHLLALFDRLDLLLQLQTVVYHHLPGQNDENLFGCQVIVNERDEVEGMNQRLLIGATQLSLQEIIDQIHALGGLAIACHIDRDSYSVISQLGFVDDGIPLMLWKSHIPLGLNGAAAISGAFRTTLH